MPTVTILSTLNRASASSPGCPLPVLENAAREAMIELCQRAKVWRAIAPTVALVATQRDYSVLSPVAHGEVCDVLSAISTVAGVSTNLTLYDPQTLMLKYPLSGDDGTPVAMSTGAGGTLALAPTPDAVGTLDTYVALRPTDTATLFDAALYAEFREALFHGTLYRVLEMPQRSWTDAGAATQHERKWTFRLASAGWRADTGFTKRALSVEPRPFA